MKQLFNADITNDNNFRCFMYKANLLENTEAGEVNGVPKNGTTASTLKNLRNFWRSLKMPLINFKVVIKLYWTKYLVLSSAGVDNVNENDVVDNNIVFTIKDTKLYFFVVTLLARDNKDYQKLFGKYS